MAQDPIQHEMHPITRILSGTMSDSSEPSDLLLEDDNLGTEAKFTESGRVSISINQKHSRLQKVLLNAPGVNAEWNVQTYDEPSPMIFGTGDTPPPQLNLVIQIIGSRGDVQPFIALGKVLKEKHGHRVRLATHATFKEFVEENGLEHFTTGGDPGGLMAYMVKNPGLIPSRDSLMHGDVAKRRKDIEQIMDGCWRSCIDASDGSDDNAKEHKPFIADAIIANPPSFAYVHCAEKLGIPFHLMFTMPWTPTQYFPHPLANVHSNSTDQRVSNFLSYPLVMIMTWQGLGDIVNKFRMDTLHLEPCSVMWTPILASSAKIPFTYCWSPALIPKPKDWGDNIAIAGFYFLNLASTFEPDPELVKFLEAGPPPVYIGFGSIVVDDPDAMTNIIFDAVKKAGVRALVSKGWGGLGKNDLDIPENIHMLGNVPHDWLFKHVSCVVHHGGAGTTATGIAMGKPTLVVPFFGDQPFWGAMVARAGAGPDPIPHKRLTADNLAAAIEKCQKPEMQAAAKAMAETIAKEKGAEVGAQRFQDFLPVDRMRCSLDPTKVAAWRVKRTNIRLSSASAAFLCHEGTITLEDLKLNRACEYDLSDQPWDPISGGASAFLGTMANLMVGAANLPQDITKAQALKASATREPRSSYSPGIGTPISSTPINSPPLSPMEKYADNTDITKAASVIVKPIAGTGMNRNLTSSTGKAVSREAKVLLSFPREFTLALGRGFHNAPKLYHDHTVRPPDKVTDLKTGLKGAGKEFSLGLYDAVTGLVTQPYEGAKEHGAAGFVKGVGKGFGGLLLKPNAAVLGALGYTIDGIYHQMHKHSTTIEHRIAAARIAEGLEVLQSSTQEERQLSVDRWNELQMLMSLGRRPSAMAGCLGERLHRKDSRSSSRHRMSRIGSDIFRGNTSDNLSPSASHSTLADTASFLSIGESDKGDPVVSPGSVKISVESPTHEASLTKDSPADIKEMPISLPQD